MKILGRLPIFAGFYGSIFEPNEDHVIESPHEYEDYEFFYDEYRNDVGEYLTKVINEKLKELFHLDIEMEFKKIDSPKYYNYSNDKIEVIYKLDEKTREQIYDKVFNNLSDFEGYIDENFTSRSGYIPYYSNEAIDWLRERDNHNFDDYIVISCLLEFLLSLEWVGCNDELYMEVMDGMPFLSGKLIESETE